MRMRKCIKCNNLISWFNYVIEFGNDNDPKKKYYLCRTCVEEIKRKAVVDWCKKRQNTCNPD